MFARLEIAKKRQQQLLNSFSSGFKRWAINKEYSVVFHDNKSEDILLNLSIFKDMNSTELIEVTLVSNQNFKLIFSIDKRKNLDKNIRNVSISKKYFELFKDSYTSGLSVFIKEASKTEYKLKQVELLITDKGISRNEIPLVIQNLFNKIIYKEQIIYLNKSNTDIQIGKILKLNNQDNCLCGIISEQTTLNIYTISSDLYFIVEISKNIFFNSLMNMSFRYEYLIDYFKCLFKEIQKIKSNYNIHIIFSIRIYFQSTKNYDDINFIYKSSINNNEFYFDIFSSIKHFTSSNIEVNKILRKINEALNIFKVISKFKNIKEIFQALKESDIFDKIIPNNLLDNSEQHLNEILNFQLSNSLYSNIFESIYIPLKEFENQKDPLKQTGSLINVILCGESFPYYNNLIQEKVRQEIYNENMTLILTFFTTKNKFEYYKHKDLNLSNLINESNDINEEEYKIIDNKTNIPPDWCNIYTISYKMLYQKIQEYNQEYYNCDEVNFYKRHPPQMDSNLEFYSDQVDEDIFNLTIPEIKNEKIQNNINITKNNNKKISLDLLKEKNNSLYRKKDEKFEENLKKIAEEYNKKLTKDMEEISTNKREIIDISTSNNINQNFADLINKLIFPIIPYYKKDHEKEN